MDFTFTMGEVDHLLRTTYLMRELGEGLDLSGRQSDIAIEIVRNPDESIVVFPPPKLPDLSRAAADVPVLGRRSSDRSIQMVRTPSRCGRPADEQCQLPGPFQVGANTPQRASSCIRGT